MRGWRMFIAAGLLLVAAALIFAGYNLWDDHRAGESADAALESLTPLITGDPAPPEGRPLYPEASAEGRPLYPEASAEESMPEIEYPDYVLNPAMDMPVQRVDGRDYIGVLSLPTLGKELPVQGEWSYPNLKASPCRFAGTAYAGDFVICAHNYVRHFGGFGKLAYGDAVEFTDMDGNVFSYEIAEIETLQPADVEKMTSGDWDLTLLTCSAGGKARVAVRCSLK